jgi:hypothetical protein
LRVVCWVIAYRDRRVGDNMRFVRITHPIITDRLQRAAISDTINSAAGLDELSRHLPTRAYGTTAKADRATFQ